MPLDKLLSVSIAARRLNVSDRTVYRLLAEGQFIALRVRGLIKITEGSVQDYFARQIALYALENGDNSDNLAKS